MSEEHSWLPIALITIGFIIPGYFLVSKYIINAPSTQTEVKVNQSPSESITNIGGEEEEEDNNEDAADFADDQASIKNEEDAVDTESITVNPNQRICVVSVGAFGNKTNAQKRIEQVYDYGFDALPEKYIKNGKELTKVGIQFAFETEEEFDTKLRAIKKRFKNAVVIKKE